MAGETYLFGPAGSGAFNNPNVWAPTVGAPPRSGQDQRLVVTSGTLVVPAGQPWDDFDVSVLGNATIAFSAVTFGNESTLNQTAPDATYTVTGGNLNNFGNIDIGGSGAQATARLNLSGGAFVNNGPIDVDGNFLVGGGGPFINNSTFTIENGIAQFQQTATGDAAGSYVIEKNGTLAFTGFFTNAAVSFAPEANGALLVGSPYAATQTLRTIRGFDQGDVITVPGQGIAVNWVQQSPEEGRLNIGGAGGAVVASIPFSGTYDPGSFAIAADPARNITTITTTKVTPPPPDKGVLQVTDPVLDLDFHGRRDLTNLAVNGPNDITLTMTNLTIRDTALQRVDFLDGSLIFDGTSPNGRYDPDENAASIARMYYTVLGRGPEFAGAHYWVEEVMEGRNLSIRDLAPGFYTSPEFRARYGENTTDQQFVSLLYRNVLGREGEPGGLNYWTNSLAQGASRAEVVVSISESYEHQSVRYNVIEASGVQFLDQPFL